jgi:hypothetical protein
MGRFSGYFEKALTVFDPEISLRCAQRDLGIKKVLAPSKNPVKYFVHKKIISRISKFSGTLTVTMLGGGGVLDPLTHSLSPKPRTLPILL